MHPHVRNLAVYLRDIMQRPNRLARSRGVAVISSVYLAAIVHGFAGNVITAGLLCLVAVCLVLVGGAHWVHRSSLSDLRRLWTISPSNRTQSRGPVANFTKYRGGLNSRAANANALADSDESKKVG